jgi:hypothetical protein
MKKLLLLVAVLVTSLGANAQLESHVKWSYAAKKTSATEAIVYIKATMDNGWHIYSQNVKEGGPIKTTFTYAPSKEYALAGKTTEPKPITKFEKTFGMNVSFFENTAIFQQKVKLKSAKAKSVNGKVEFMTCNDIKCLPPDEVEFSIPLGK